jgi:hypothetical protein
MRKANGIVMLDDLLVLLGDARLTARLPKGPRSLWALLSTLSRDREQRVLGPA